MIDLYKITQHLSANDLLKMQHTEATLGLFDLHTILQKQLIALQNVQRAKSQLGMQSSILDSREKEILELLIVIDKEFPLLAHTGNKAVRELLLHGATESIKTSSLSPLDVFLFLLDLKQGKNSANLQAAVVIKPVKMKVYHE